jgi:hypothetical protein
LESVGSSPVLTVLRQPMFSRFVFGVPPLFHYAGLTPQWPSQEDHLAAPFLIYTAGSRSRPYARLRRLSVDSTGSYKALRSTGYTRRGRCSMVFLPRNQLQVPHPSGTSGLASLGLLAPFVLPGLSSGILSAQSVSFNISRTADVATGSSSSRRLEGGCRRGNRSREDGRV